MKKTTFAVLALTTQLVWAPTAIADAPYLGMGSKVGEMTATSAAIHVRLTEGEGQNLDFTVPGKDGDARIYYADNPEMMEARTTEWHTADATKDHYLQFDVADLKPWTRIFYTTETREAEGTAMRMSAVASFMTAPASDTRQAFDFQITTCQSNQGLPTYARMLDHMPAFAVSAGDTVYYDKEEDVRTVEGAYRLFQKDYGTPYTINYFSAVGTYFQKDDHDYRWNDADPFMKGRWIRPSEGTRVRYTDTAPEDKTGYTFDDNWISHEEGIAVFKTVLPSSDLPYRTFRWGKGVQIWLLEGRDFRSANDMPDGPEKTIWGETQRAWLKKTLLESDADFRVIISPTPLIGPDKKTKTDNHANAAGFMYEGRAFMDWMIDTGITDNTMIVCGDRHWQYHSIYKDAVNEFCAGPTSHFKVQKVIPPEEDVIKQPYGKGTGGFLTVSYGDDKTLTFTHYNEEAREQNKVTFER